MTIEEIYGKLSEHMMRGIVMHEQMAEYYDFLGLMGYKRCHEYHFLSELCEYRKLCRYYINHHGKLLPKPTVEQPKVIPESWYKYARQDVDAATRQKAVKNGLEMWRNWETETKELYEQMYSELMKLGEIADMMKVGCLVEDVDHELKKVERYVLEKESTDYSIESIMAEQKRKHKKYKKLVERMGMNKC